MKESIRRMYIENMEQDLDEDFRATLTNCLHRNTEDDINRVWHKSKMLISSLKEELELVKGGKGNG